LTADISKLDIAGLNITVTSGDAKAGAKVKGKAQSEGLEILNNATLKLKAGVHYALIGRNGTGKSSEHLNMSFCPGTSNFDSTFESNCRETDTWHSSRYQDCYSAANQKS